MARKAKGAFWVSLVALLFITVFAGFFFRSIAGELAVLRPLVIAVLGTVYLCSGLRFDFREELERMDVIRAWPLASPRVFLAMLLPEVLLVSLLIDATVLLDCLFTRGDPGSVAGVILGTPVLVFAWVAVDSVVFLFAPVRLVPGRDGFVQNAGNA
jgi:hypothetical protein